MALTAKIPLEMQFVDSATSAITCLAARRQRPRVRSRAHISIPPEGDATYSGVVDGIAAHLIRLLYIALRFDETHPFQWYLDHKLIQALLFNAYVPNLLPVTHGCAALLQHSMDRGIHVAQAVEDIFPTGHLVKRALTAGSGEGQRANCGDEVFERLARGGGILECRHCVSEQWVVQQHIDICREFRVHSVEGRVVPSLTDGRYCNISNCDKTRHPVNAFVSRALLQLPIALTAGTMYAWDVAETAHNQFVVIEVNVTGRHPRYRPGFQCSGFFQELPGGVTMVARLLTFVESHYNVVVDFPSFRTGFDQKAFAWYQAVDEEMRNISLQ